MNPTDVAYIKGAIAFVLLAATGLSAFRLWLRSRPRSLPQADEIIATLRAENARDREDLETRMVELEARVQFTERLLVKEKEPVRLPPPDADRPG